MVHKYKLLCKNLPRLFKVVLCVWEEKKEDKLIAEDFHVFLLYKLGDLKYEVRPANCH